MASPKRGRPLGSLNKPKENRVEFKLKEKGKEKKAPDVADVKEEAKEAAVVSETPKKG